MIGYQNAYRFMSRQKKVMMRLMANDLLIQSFFGLFFSNTLVSEFNFQFWLEFTLLWYFLEIFFKMDHEAQFWTGGARVLYEK